jgi:hypothetical protein
MPTHCTLFALLLVICQVYSFGQYSIAYPRATCSGDPSSIVFYELNAASCATVSLPKPTCTTTQGQSAIDTCEQPAAMSNYISKATVQYFGLSVYKDQVCGSNATSTSTLSYTSYFTGSTNTRCVPMGSSEAYKHVCAKDGTLTSLQKCSDEGCSVGCTAVSNPTSCIVFGNPNQSGKFTCTPSSAVAVPTIGFVVVLAILLQL